MKKLASGLKKNKEYKNNSASKDKLRKKWLEYIKHNKVKQGQLRIITLPAEEMQDLFLFAKAGYINLERTETGAFSVKSGKVVCYEKSTNIYQALHNKLVDARNFNEDVGRNFQQQYQRIMRNTNNNDIFPVDALNLDFDECLSKSTIPIGDLIRIIFDFQQKNKVNFSLFLTLPHTEGSDDNGYIKFLKEILKTNLKDTSTKEFRDEFVRKHNSVKKLTYEEFIIICLAKTIIKESSNHHFEISKHDFFAYGDGKKRRRMFSLLFNFSHLGLSKAGHSLYFREVMKALSPIVEA